MSYLGYTLPTGDGIDNNTTSVVSVSLEPCGVSGILGAGHLWFVSIGGSGSRSQAMRLVIYSSDGTPKPAAFIAATTEVVITDLTGAGQWIDFLTWDGAAPAVQAGLNYWIGAWWGTQVNAGIVSIERIISNTVRQYFADPDAYASTGAPPNFPLTQSGVTGERHYSLYFDILDEAVAQSPRRMPLGV